MKRPRTNTILAFFSILIIICPFAHAEFKEQGELSFQTRAFRDDNKDTTEDRAVGMFGRVDLTYAGTNVDKFTFRGYGVMDKKDSDRNFLIIEDCNVSWYLGEEEDKKFSLGYQLFNWTATEVFHPVDVINSRNLDSNMESPEKKGELAVEFTHEIGEGQLSFYFFPKAEKPHYPGTKSRLGAGIALEKPVWVKNHDHRSTNGMTPQGAIRFTQTVDNADFSFHILHHLDRNLPIVEQNVVVHPVFLIPIAAYYTPYYFQVLQTGGTLQYAMDGWLFKLEAAYLDFRDDDVTISTSRGDRNPKDHTQTAFGVEYTMNHDNGTDSNFFLEGQGIFGADTQRRAELSVFQKDIMFGWRLAFNDAMGKELFAYVIRDIERKKETLFNFAYSQRLTDNWKIKTGLRVFRAPLKETLETGLEAYHRDSFVFLNVSRFF